MTVGGGYIKLFRQIQDHSLWTSEPACRGRAWVDLIILAAHTPRTVTIKGQPVQLERGDLPVSVRFLARRWKWGSGRPPYSWPS